ncbi:MAG: hypothetical protein JXX28_01915 [Deltaproteobacteria bacterium]|nr:hypothetical protein [Deltaproteobacteria bacterium]
MTEAPSDYKTAGIFMIVSGVLTLITSFTLVLTLIWLCIGVFWLIPMAVGILEIIIGIGVASGQPKPTAKTIAIVGAVAAFLTGNIIGVVMEILAFVFMERPEVSEYLRGF